MRRGSRPGSARRRATTHQLLRRDGGRCVCCETRFTWDLNPPTIEHLTPLSQGGRNLPANLVLLCGRCNHGRDHQKIAS